MPLLYETARKAANISASEVSAIADKLRGQIAGEIRMDHYNRLMYSTDASMYQMMPVGVVVPRSADDVEATIRVAREHGVPVMPRGGGTALAGQTTNHAIVMDFSKYMRNVLEVSPEERWARVQPGIVNNHLSAAVRQHGLMYAPDPVTSARATVGGGIGNNSCGPHSVIYGKTLDHILEVDAILSDGSRVHFAPHGRRGAGGQACAERPGGRDLPRDAPPGVGARRRDRPTLPAHPAPRHGLQPRRLHRQRPHEPHPRGRRLGRDAGRRYGGAGQPRAVAAASGTRRAALHRPHRMYGGVGADTRAQPLRRPNSLAT